MGGTHPTTILERLNTYIQPWEEHIPQLCQKGSALTSDHGRPSLPPCQKGSTLISDHGRPSLPPCQKGSTLTSNHGRLSLPPCRKNTTLISDHGRPNLPPCQKGSTLTSNHGRPSVPPCQKGSRTHQFPLEGTSIWRTTRFSLKYSNFTFAISSIELH